MQPRTHVPIALALLLCPACAPEDELDFRDTSTGGIVFNTHQMEDERFSELRHPTNIGLEVAIEYVTLPAGVTAPEFVVQHGELTVYDGEANAYTGDALLDSYWWLSGWRDGPEKAMRLAARTVLGGVPHYLFTHDTSDGPQSNCPTPPDDPKETGWARLLSNFTLDESTGEITAKSGNTYVACTTGATGKAARWGYYDRAVTLKDFDILETAIRVVRADYCYDADSYTKAGVGVWLVDRWGGVQKHTTTDPKMRVVEAVWGREGLLCRGAATRLGEDMPLCAAAPLCKPGLTIEQYKDALFMTYLP